VEALRKHGLEPWQNGVLFVGDDGWLISDYHRHEIGPAARKAAWQAPPQTIAASPGHQREWLLASALRTRPSCSFAYAGPLTETVLLANVALRAARGRRLQWDATNLRTDSDAVNELLDVNARAGFSA
jgi:hypothetical protein